MSYSFALLVCGRPNCCAELVGALASATDIAHLACPRTHVPSLDCLPLFSPEQRPLLVLSQVRNSTHLTYLSQALGDADIPFASVWAESALPTEIDGAFHYTDFSFLAQVDAPALSPHRLSPALVAHILNTAQELMPPRGITVALPLGSVTLAMHALIEPPRRLDDLAEARRLGELYCKHYNEALPRTCRRCQRPVAVGLPCFACGQDPVLRAQVLLPDEHGYFSVSADAHDEVTAFFSAPSADLAALPNP